MSKDRCRAPSPFHRPCRRHRPGRPDGRARPGAAGSPRSRSRSTIPSPRAASPTCISACWARSSARCCGQQIIVDIKAGRGRHAGAGHAAQRQAGRPDARLHEHQQPALSALPADQLGSAEGLHLHQRPVGLHDGHRRARRLSLEDVRGHDRRRQEGTREVQLRHLGHRRHRPADDDRGRAGDRRQVHARPLQGRRGMDAGADGRRDPFHRRRRRNGRRSSTTASAASWRWPPSSASRATRTCRP